MDHYYYQTPSPAGTGQQYQDAPGGYQGPGAAQQHQQHQHQHQPPPAPTPQPYALGAGPQSSPVAGTPYFPPPPPSSWSSPAGAAKTEQVYEAVPIPPAYGSSYYQSSTASHSWAAPPLPYTEHPAAVWPGQNASQEQYQSAGSAHPQPSLGHAPQQYSTTQPSYSYSGASSSYQNVQSYQTPPPPSVAPAYSVPPASNLPSSPPPPPPTQFQQQQPSYQQPFYQEAPSGINSQYHQKVTPEKPHWKDQYPYSYGHSSEHQQQYSQPSHSYTPNVTPAVVPPVPAAQTYPYHSEQASTVSPVWQAPPPSSNTSNTPSAYSTGTNAPNYQTGGPGELDGKDSKSYYSAPPIDSRNNTPYQYQQPLQTGELQTPPPPSIQASHTAPSANAVYPPVPNGHSPIPATMTAMQPQQLSSDTFRSNPQSQQNAVNPEATVSSNVDTFSSIVDQFTGLNIQAPTHTTPQNHSQSLPPAPIHSQDPSAWSVPVATPDPQAGPLISSNPAPSAMQVSVLNSKRELFPMNSPPEEPYVACPERVKIDYAVYWYFHPQTPDFLICSYCYTTHIAPSKFAQVFTREWKKEGVNRTCMFHVLRMKKVLWPTAIATGDIGPVQDYMGRQVKYKACPGTQKIDHTANITWYSHTSNDPEGFVVCEACYHDTILATNFVNGFVASPQQQEQGMRWACNLAMPPALRAVESARETTTWTEATKIPCKRYFLPDCPGNRVGRSGESAWYKPVREIATMAICETCYYDNIMNTEFMLHFEFFAPAGQLGWTCNWEAWPIRFPYYIALREKNFDKWWYAADKYIKSSRCNFKGTRSDTWYTFASHPNANFDVCPTCYEGLFCSWGANDHLTVRQDPKSDSPVVCDLNPESGRGRKYATKYGEAFDKRCFSVFQTYVLAVCDVPTCPRDSRSGNRHWYGFSDAHFCEECYNTFIKDTSLANQLELKRELLDGEFICDVYSPRMREKWDTACATGDVAPFREFARHRAEVYERTVPQVQRIVQMNQMRMMLSMSNFQMAMMAHAGDSINNMVGDTSQSWTVTTNGFTGTGGSEFGAHAQAVANQSSANAVRMDDMALGDMLEAQWRAVE